MEFDFEKANEMLAKNEIKMMSKVEVSCPLGFQVADFDSMKEALNIALGLRLSLREYESDKKSRLKPLNDQRDSINKYFKPVIETINANIELLTSRINSFWKDCPECKYLDGFQSEMGSLYFRKKTSFEIENINEIPTEFLQTTVNEELVMNAINAGVKIPGVKAIETKEMTLKLAAQE